MWLYFQFPLSFREVEELMLQRGVVVSYETIGAGMPSSGRLTPTSCAVDAPPRRQMPPRRGLHRRSTAKSTTCGARSTSTATYSTSWSNVARNTKAAKKFFPPIAQGLAVRAAGDRHRQARQLPGRPPRGDAVGGPPPVEVPEQSRRELPSAHPATRAANRDAVTENVLRIFGVSSDGAYALCERSLPGLSEPQQSDSVA